MSFRQNTKRIFTAALVFWLSGIVVLFCCGNMPTAKAAETESCPLAKKGHCAKNAENALAFSFEKQPATFDCCAFPAKIFDKERKLEKPPKSAVATETIKVAAPQFSSVEFFFRSPKLYQSFVGNQGDVYLRNRVFRI